MTEKSGNKTPLQLESRNALNPTKFLQCYADNKTILSIVKTLLLSKTCKIVIIFNKKNLK
jgi:hypothetical protein